MGGIRGRGYVEYRFVRSLFKRQYNNQIFIKWGRESREKYGNKYSYSKDEQCQNKSAPKETNPVIPERKIDIRMNSILRKLNKKSKVMTNFSKDRTTPFFHKLLQCSFVLGCFHFVFP